MVHISPNCPLSMTNENPFKPPSIRPAPEAATSPEVEERSLQERIKSLDLMTWEGREGLLKFLDSRGLDKYPDWNLDSSGKPILLGKNKIELVALHYVVKQALENRLCVRKVDECRLIDFRGKELSDPSCDDLLDVAGHVTNKIPSALKGYLGLIHRDFLKDDKTVEGLMHLAGAVGGTFPKNPALYHKWQGSRKLADEPKHHAISLQLDYIHEVDELVELFFKYLVKFIKKEQMATTAKNDLATVRRLDGQLNKIIDEDHERYGRNEVTPEELYQERKILIAKVRDILKGWSDFLDIKAGI